MSSVRFLADGYTQPEYIQAVARLHKPRRVRRDAPGLLVGRMVRLAWCYGKG